MEAEAWKSFVSAYFREVAFDVAHVVADPSVRRTDDTRAVADPTDPGSQPSKNAQEYRCSQTVKHM
jgi:hypothetical protein